MFGLCGYNFCLDKNAIDVTPTNLNNIKNVQLQNGIFDHFNVTRDVTNAYSSEIPTAWDFMTIMDSNFEGNINAGNVDYIVSQISSIKVKRRIYGTFNWITLAELPINTVEDFKFNIKDYFNADGIKYEYALVPVINGIEGNYLTNTVDSKLNGVFICDYETIFKFYAGVSYGNIESIQKVGVYEPIGSKYPIVITNAKTDYHIGSISGTILNPDFEDTRQIDRNAIVKYQNLLDKFLKNKRAKIIKDWNGMIYLVYITSNPNFSYSAEYGMGISDVSFNWTEQGDPNNQKDLYDNGLVKVVE